MRTRSKGPEPNEDRSPAESAPLLSSFRAIDGHKEKRKDGKGLTLAVDGSTIRTSFEAPVSTPDSSLEARKPTLSGDKAALAEQKPSTRVCSARNASPNVILSHTHHVRRRACNPWTTSILTIAVTLIAGFLAFGVFYSFTTRQLDPKGCAMSYMRSAYAAFPDFDTEHTRFASKYSLYLYREEGIDDDSRVKGIPILFIPGNAGSYRQVRPYAAEAAVFFQQALQNHPEAIKNGKRPLDFFTVDFNEDITAFHGQTLLDQAEYLNEAVAYILSLYHNPHRSLHDPDLPDPTAVILLGHSMGGIVARTMLTLPNHQSNSVNTIITLAAPHARAPVSFDADIVNTYKSINGYWRAAYSQKWANNNPLWHVTLISIAGGGLDTVVPSDYSTIASLVPPTHGFTVFTSSIPRVWTGMDHLAIMWCDQLRKSVVRALYDVIDAGRPSQTRQRDERMRAFKKWLLTGLEDVAEKTLQHKGKIALLPISQPFNLISLPEPKTLLTLEDNSNDTISQGKRLVLRQLGQSGKARAHLLPIPQPDSQDRKRFTLLTDQRFGQSGTKDPFEVMFCSVFPLHSGHSSQLFSANLDLSSGSLSSTRLACKNAASDAILLPASTRNASQPFEPRQPFSYLQYDLEQLIEHQFVAVIDKASVPSSGWVVAEFASRSEALVRTRKSLAGLITSGLAVSAGVDRPTMLEIDIPSVQSSLLAYRLSIGKRSYGSESELFTPLLRQYISDPYESKYFVNVQEAEISMHGVAPYLPPALKARAEFRGLALQIWSDPTCNDVLEVSIVVDLLGSVGKLWMRYRTVFAAFPLLIVALILRKQFKVHDETGSFISFGESMDNCLRSSIPMLFLGLTMLGMSFADFGQGVYQKPTMQSLFSWRSNATETIVDYTRNDLLLGNSDPFFWFLIPLFGVISIGICILLNYITLLLITSLSWIYSTALRLSKRPITAFAVTPIQRRLITTCVLVFLVWTVIPYQFLYIILCFAQLATCVRALILATGNVTAMTYDYYNYVHSILMLMLWILPINIPTLVVWIHNITLHWLTPFSSHHNVLSILPFVLLVETLSTGKMIPRVSSWARHLTSILFFTLAIYSAVYGITYAYLLHSVVNIVCVWLMIIHLSCEPLSVSGFTHLLGTTDDVQHDVKKQP